MIPSSENSRILIITAHPDDELLSCGGLIYQESKFHKIDVCVVTHKGERWQDNFFKVCDELGANRAISLDIPLWISKKGRVLYFFDRDEFELAISKEIPGDFLYDYDLYLTHGLDGDIDNHPHHKHLADIITKSFFGRQIWHFMAFPRLGVKSHHPLYAYHQSLEWQESFFKKGFLSPRLAERVDKVYQLDETTVIKKKALKKIYMKNKDHDYRMVNYPIEMFVKNKECCA